jgi:hypothetical protein
MRELHSCVLYDKSYKQQKVQKEKFQAWIEQATCGWLFCIRIAIRRTTTVLLEPLVVKAGKLKYIQSKRKAQSSDSGAPCSLSFDNPNKQ